MESALVFFIGPREIMPLQLLLKFIQLFIYV